MTCASNIVEFKRKMLRRLWPLFPNGQRPEGVTGPILHGAQLFPAWTNRGSMRQTSVTKYPDGHDWYEVSFSLPDRCPAYEHILQVRRTFFRPEVLVVQVFPPEAEHINFHPYVLHLWQRVSGERMIGDLRFGSEALAGPVAVQP